jgi:hypothetical protein
VKNNFALICNEVEFGVTGTPSFKGVFTELRYAGALPIKRDKFNVVVNFSPEDKESHNIQVFIKSPTGENIANSREQNIILNEKADAATDALGYIVEFKDVLFKEEGTYLVQFLIDGHLFEELKLKVVKTPS